MKSKSLFSAVGILFALGAHAQDPQPQPKPQDPPSAGAQEPRKFNWKAIKRNIDGALSEVLREYPEFETLAFELPQNENEDGDELNGYITVSFKNSLWSKNSTELRLHANIRMTSQNKIKINWSLEGYGDVIKALQVGAHLASEQIPSGEMKDLKEQLEKLGKAKTIPEIFDAGKKLVELLKEMNAEANDEQLNNLELTLNKEETEIALTTKTPFLVYREGDVNVTKVIVGLRGNSIRAEIVTTQPVERDDPKAFAEFRTLVLGGLEEGGEVMSAVRDSANQILTILKSAINK